jgi:hypothetical protein
MVVTISKPELDAKYLRNTIKKEEIMQFSDILKHFKP